MIFCVFAILFLVLGVYPFIIYPWVLAKLPKQPLAQPVAGQDLSFTLVFCAYNEEVSLPEKLDNVRALKARYPDLEVLAYSDMSSDRTLEMLQAESDILTAVPATERLGKAWGMRQLVARATGDVIIFTDANVSLDIDAIDHLQSYFSDPAIGTVSGYLKYTNTTGENETADVGNQYWSLEERIKALESQTGSTMGADGAIFARRREGYPEVPPHLLDDLTASISPLFDGLRVISAPDVIAYERLTTDSRDEYRRKRRISCRAFNTHRYLMPRLMTMSGRDKFKYFSHKFIRWMSPFLMAFSALFGLIWLIFWLGLFGGLGMAVLAGLAVWVAWKVGITKVRKAIEIALSLMATGQGVLESLNGKTYQTWTPAKSRNS